MKQDNELSSMMDFLEPDNYDRWSPFMQHRLTSNGYMNKSGVCFGLSVDWILYNIKHQASSYVDDKYYKKLVHINDDSSDEDISSADHLGTANFYNRINFYQYQANKEFHNLNITDLEKYGSSVKLMSDYGMVCYTYGKNNDSSTYQGHACAYKFAYDSNTKEYSYVYFDPNLGEYENKGFSTKAEAQKSLYELLKDASSSIYSVHSEANEEGIKPETFNNAYIMDHSEDYAWCMNKGWKMHKDEIEELGTYDYSLSYKELIDSIDTAEYYNYEYDNVMADTVVASNDWYTS